MDAKSLMAKRRKYNHKIKNIRYYLMNYYNCKQLSFLQFKSKRNFALSEYPFLSKYYQSNSPEIAAKIAVKILENILVKCKQRIKELDKAISAM